MAPLYLRVSGRVQGVGFRWYVGQVAVRLQLAGWVRNCPDGTVEVAVDGAPQALEAMMSALRRGPAGADVVCVETFEIEPIDPPIATPFRVMR